MAVSTGVYADAFPAIEDRARRAILSYHGGELPVGEAVVVPTGVMTPRLLISTPTKRDPDDELPEGTVHPFLAARAVFRLWARGSLEDGIPLRQAVHTIGMPGLRTGTGGVTPPSCARQVAAAWQEVFEESGHAAAR